MVSTEGFHASASSKGVKCFSLVIECVVLASNCSLETRGKTLTETSHVHRGRVRTGKYMESKSSKCVTLMMPPSAKSIAGY
jgi:hypothetical protein